MDTATDSRLVEGSYLVFVVVLHGLDVVLVPSLVLQPLLPGVRPLLPEPHLLQLQALLEHLPEHLATTRRAEPVIIWSVCSEKSEEVVSVPALTLSSLVRALISRARCCTW